MEMTAETMACIRKKHYDDRLGKFDWRKDWVGQTFRSLNVLAAENCTEMGKNAEESAGGTVNSIEPLQEMQHQLVKSSQIGLRCMGTDESRERDAVKKPAIWIVYEKYRPLQNWIPRVISANGCIIINSKSGRKLIDARIHSIVKEYFSNLDRLFYSSC